MKRNGIRAFLVFFACFLFWGGVAAPVSHAEDTAAASWLTVVRGGVLAHDVGLFGGSEEHGADLNLELLFVSPAWMEKLWAPHPHLGVCLHTDNDTNQVYGGLTWEKVFINHIFLDFSLGLTLHDGDLHCSHHYCHDDKDLGSAVLFREALELGYNITQHHSLSLIVSHMSNAGLSNDNDGMDHVGIRYGYSF